MSLIQKTKRRERIAMGNFSKSSEASVTQQAETDEDQSRDKYAIHLAPPDMLYDYYECPEFLAAGSFGTVYKLTHKDNSHSLAVKAFIPSYREQAEEAEQEFMYELRTFSRVGEHPNLVKFVVAFREYDVVRDFLVAKIACEFCEEGDLTGIYKHPVGKFYTEETVREVVLQCCRGLNHMLKVGFLHRDIKPENILVKSYDPLFVVVADMNFGEEWLNCADKAGTIFYKAPEVSMKRYRTIKNSSGNRVVCPKADVFSLGIIAFELLAGRQKPFSIPAKETRELNENYHPEITKKFLERARQRICYRDGVQFRPRAHWLKVSGECKRVVARMLRFKASERMSYSEIITSEWCQKEFDGEQKTLYDHVLWKEREAGRIVNGTMFSQFAAGKPSHLRL